MSEQQLSHMSVAGNGSGLGCGEVDRVDVALTQPVAGFTDQQVCIRNELGQSGTRSGVTGVGQQDIGGVDAYAEARSIVVHKHGCNSRAGRVRQERPKPLGPSWRSENSQRLPVDVGVPQGVEADRKVAEVIGVRVADPDRVQLLQ